MLVALVVDDDEVQIEILRQLLVDPPQEAQELLVHVPKFALGDHRAGEHCQGDKQCGGAVRDVEVGDIYAQAQRYRQQRLGSIEDLDMRFIDKAVHRFLVRWDEEEPDDVSFLLDKKGIDVGEIEGFLAVRLQRTGL